MEERIRIKEIKVGYTHSGTFHADDVFSSAFLRILNPDIEIRRVAELPKLGLGEIAFDIGLGLFDHHQANNEVRPNGVPYAAFGKLFRYFGDELGLSEKSLCLFEKEVVIPLDSKDNGGHNNPLSTLIRSMNPNWNEEVNLNDRFFETVKVAETLLLSHIKRLRSNEQAERGMLEKAREAKDGVLVLNRFVPTTALKRTDVLAVVFPSNRGGVNIRLTRGEFPVEWKGKEVVLAGHKAFCPGFLLVADTPEAGEDIAHALIGLIRCGEISLS